MPHTLVWFRIGLICKAALRSVEIFFGIQSWVWKKIRCFPSFYFDLLSVTTFPTKETSNFDKVTNKTSHFLLLKVKPLYSFMLSFDLHQSPKGLFTAIMPDLWPSFKVSSGPKMSISIIGKLILDYETDCFVCFALMSPIFNRMYRYYPALCFAFALVFLFKQKHWSQTHLVCAWLRFHTVQCFLNQHLWCITCLL